MSSGFNLVVSDKISCNYGVSYIKRFMLCLLMMKHIFEGTVLSETYSVINHCDRRTTHLGDLDISFVLLKMSSKFLLHLECYFLSPKRHIKIR